MRPAIRRTTIALRLPPPILIKTLLPQPLAYVIPIPNISPPKTYLGQLKTEFL